MATNKLQFERQMKNHYFELFNNIVKKGVLPCNSKVSIEENFINNISINLSSDLKIFFNNRGQHRLSIAKIIKLKTIPVKISVIKNMINFEKFVFFDKLNIQSVATKMLVFIIKS